MSIETLREESKATVRRPIAKVIVTWTDPLIDPSIDAVPSEVHGDARNQAVPHLDPHLPMAEVERLHILNVLRHTEGNKTRAAAILGISTRTLYNKLAEY